MSYGIVDEKTGHEWDKVNLVTKFDSSGSYDVWQCLHCNKKFKRRGVSWHPLETQCKPKRRPTKHAPDVVESAASVSIPPASEVSASEADSTPATTQVM